MNSAASLLDPASNPVTYAVSVLTLYGELPDSPARTNPQDQRQARIWFDRGVPLPVVEAAFLLASLRRIRPPGASPLPRIRSLAYFQPVIDEFLENPVSEAYVQTCASNSVASSTRRVRLMFTILRSHMIGNTVRHDDDIRRLHVAVHDTVAKKSNRTNSASMPTADPPCGPSRLRCCWPILALPRPTADRTLPTTIRIQKASSAP